MIPKVTKGDDPGGLVRYLLDVDPGRTRNVHIDPRVVAASPEIEAWWGGRVLDMGEGRPIGRQLDAARRAFRTQVPGGKHTWHCSLSLRADEGELPDERWAAIARRFVKGMDFDDPESPKSPCSWVAVHHGPSAAGNPHIHIAVSLVRGDGTAADVYRDFVRAQRVAREIEVEFGLRRLESRDRGRATRGVSRAELSRQQERRAAEPERRTLARAVRAAAATAGSEAEFVANLRGAGLSPRPWFARGSGAAIVGGYSVQQDGSPIRLGGRNLAADLSLPRLRTHHGWAQTAESVEAWQSQRAPRADRLQRASERVWEQRAGEVGQLREWLRSVPLDDARTWAAIAHDLAGIYAAGSRAVEKDQPGPLAEAADSLSKSAMVRGRDAVPRPAGMPDTRGVALLVASASRRGRGSVAEAALWKQLGNTARAVHDAHVAVRDAQRAEEIAVVMKGRLRELSVAPASERGAARAAVVERPRLRSVERDQGGRGR